MTEETPSALQLERGEEPVGRSSSARERAYTPAKAKKRRRNLIILAAMVVLVIGGVLWWHYLSSYESTDDAQADVHLYPISAASPAMSWGST